VKDPQAERVYRMESEELSGHCRSVCDDATLKRFLRQGCAIYEVPVPQLVEGGRKLGGWYDSITCSIGLNPDCGRNLLTLAHELAHHVVTVKWPRAQDHGATFVRVYAELLDLMRLVPIAGMRQICRRYGVRMAIR